MTADATMTQEGIEARNGVEADTDRLCASIWRPIGDSGAARFSELIMPIHDAVDAAGTYADLRLSRSTWQAGDRARSL